MFFADPLPDLFHPLSAAIGRLWVSVAEVKFVQAHTYTLIQLCAPRVSGAALSCPPESTDLLIISIRFWASSIVGGLPGSLGRLQPLL